MKVFFLLLLLTAGAALAQRQVERLDRGLVAVRQQAGGVFVSWRWLTTDPPDTTFSVFRREGDGNSVSLTAEPISQTTCFLDKTAAPDKRYTWSLRSVRAGKESPLAGEAEAPSTAWHAIPMRLPADCAPNDASLGDVDGDGRYEIILHQAPRGKDNSQTGLTGQPRLQGYRLDGTFLWEINLGKNIREGAHYTQFMVYDFDGDGRAEVACKTADGTVDGKGNVLGNPAADHRATSGDRLGKILTGPEFLTIFDGASGAALASVPFEPARGRVEDWGDKHGNRVDRFLAAVAFFDGQRPSLLMSRGYYAKTMLVAWDWRDDKLTKRWTFDTEDGRAGHAEARGQGNHNLSVADVDGDGKDEILFGAMCVDDDGSLLWNSKLGHGDAMHVSDLDPTRPGLEVFGIHEHSARRTGVSFHDAKTGKILWTKPELDVARGCAFDIDPRHAGHECWASHSGDLYDCAGNVIGKKPRLCNMGIWWDGDAQRELLSGTRLSKWNWEKGVEVMLLDTAPLQCSANNGSKSNPSLCADLWGDWREEVIYRTFDNKELRIFTSTTPTTIRRPCLMQDPVYRLGIAWQNVGYNQSAHLSGAVEVGKK